MSGLSKYLDEMGEQDEEVRQTLTEITQDLCKHDAEDGEHFQRVQEFNSVVFWLTKVVNDGLPEAIDEFSKEVKGVLK